MRLGNKWIAAPAAGLVLLVGGIGVASAMSDDRPASVSTTASTLTDDRGALSGQDSASDLNDDRGTRSGQDSASDRNDDHGAFSGEDSPSDRNDDRGGVAGRDDNAVTGSSAQRARSAALAAVPGATVREVERERDSAGAVWEVELVQRDGTRVEVDLNDSFQTVKIERSGHDG